MRKGPKLKKVDGRAGRMCAAAGASAETDRHIMRCEQKFEIETCHMPLFNILEIRWHALGKGYPPTTSSTWPFRTRLGLGISGARARRRPARDESPVARRCVVSDTSRTPIKNAPSPRHIDERRCRRGPCYAQQRRIPSRYPFGFPSGARRVVLWCKKIDFMMSFSTSSKGKLAPRPQISFCLFSDYSARIIIVSYQTTRLDSYYTYPATKYMLVQQP